MKRFVLIFAVLLAVVGIAPIGVEASGGAQVFVAANGQVLVNARRTPVRNFFFGRRVAPVVVAPVAVSGFRVRSAPVIVNGFGVPVYQSFGVQSVGGCCNGGGAAVQSFSFRTFGY